MPLKTTHSSEPVTSLHIIGGHIVAGVGSCLRVYEIQQSRCVHCSLVLPCRRIHGIKPDYLNATLLAVYGGKSVRVVKLSHGETSYVMEHQTPVREFEDWVWNLCWLTRDDNGTSHIALVLGHNVILNWEWSKDVILHRVDCEEKCILYSATFIGSVWENLVLAAGTVFNQVVLWSPCGKKSENGQSKVIYRLKGHQGVIFSIDYNATHSLICSVSDDRSIRIWKLNFPTRKGITEPSLVDWDGVESELLHVLYGHEARVWGVKILSNHFVSIGEDATCCIWDYCGQITKKFKGHKGKSIWSMAVSDEETFVVTGGGDTSIRVWCLTDADCQAQTSQQTMQLPEEDDFARIVTMQDYDSILIMTNNGVLYKYCVSSSDWQTLMSCTTFRSYTIMSLSPDRSTIALGNINGELRLIHQISADSGNSVNRKMTCLVHSKQLYGHGQKIFNIVWLSNMDILTTGPEGKIVIWKLNLSSSELSLSQVRSFILPACKQHWVSSAAVLPEDQALVCGDRGGTVHLYHLTQENNGPSQSFAKIHGKAGVTDICCHGDYVYTAGKDGQYRVYTYQGRKLCLLNIYRVFKGFEWIAKLIFTDEDDLHVYGFHTNNFVLWSINQSQKLLEIPCGGGHRAWGSNISPGGDQFRFVYLKTKDICLYTSRLTTSHVILQGLHGRKISGVKHLTSSMSDTGLPVQMFVTASEDTSIIISALLYNSRGIAEHVPLKMLQGHISSVMALAICRSMQSDGTVHSVMIFSAGGRAEIRIWNLLLIHSSNQKNCDNQSNCKSSVRTCMQCDGCKSRCTGLMNTGSIQSNSSVDRIHQNFCDKCKTRRTASGRENNCLHYANDFSLLQNSCSEIGADSREDVELCDSNKETLIPNPICGKSDRQIATEDVEQTDIRHLLDVTKMCVVENLGGYMLCQKHEMKNHKPWKEHHLSSDPEMRIVDLSAFTASDMTEVAPSNIYFIVAACSDGFLRMFAFDREEKEISLIMESSYHSNCVLKVEHIIHRTEACSHVIVLSAATDGNVAVWDFTHLCRQFLRYYQQKLTDTGKRSRRNKTGDFTDVAPKETLRVHQSGINSLHTLKVEGGRYLVVSGGDDNGISILDLLVEPRNVGELSELSLLVKIYAQKIKPHAAQVTGVYLLSAELLLSTSIDQRVCLWKLDKSEGQIQMVMIACQTVTVADISEMDVWSNRETHGVVVCGEGMATLEVGDLATI